MPNLAVPSDSNWFGLRHFNPIAYETDASVSSKIGFLEKILKSTTRGAG